MMGPRAQASNEMARAGTDGGSVCCCLPACSYVPPGWLVGWLVGVGWWLTELSVFILRRGQGMTWRFGTVHVAGFWSCFSLLFVISYFSFFLPDLERRAPSQAVATPSHPYPSIRIRCLWVVG